MDSAVEMDGYDTLPGPPEAPVVPGVTYYVDSESGVDSNDGLSAASPFRTIARALESLDKRGGDKLVMRGVFYEQFLIHDLNELADASRPTFITAAQDAQGGYLPAVLKGGAKVGFEHWPFDQANQSEGFGDGTGNYLKVAFFISNSHHLFIQGVQIEGFAGAGFLCPDSSHLTISEVDLAWLGGSAINVFSSAPAERPLLPQVVVAHNDIYASNLGQMRNATTNTGLSMGAETVSIAHVDGFDIYGNSISHTMKEGIDIKVGSARGQVRFNTVTMTRGSAIYVNEAVESSIHHNHLSYMGFWDDGLGKGIRPTIAVYEEMLARQGADIGAFPAINNTGGNGILISTGDLLTSTGANHATGVCRNIDLYENVVVWSRKNGISVIDRWSYEGNPGGVLDDIQVFNNVVYGASHYTGDGLNLSGYLTRSSIRNNLVGGSLTGAGVSIINEYAGEVDYSHNVYWNNKGGPGEPEPTALKEDPLVVMEPATLGDPFDFQLLPGSPAIDQVEEPDLLTIGQHRDLGAFEYGVSPWGTPAHP